MIKQLSLKFIPIVSFAFVFSLILTTKVYAQPVGDCTWCTSDQQAEDFKDLQEENQAKQEEKEDVRDPWEDENDDERNSSKNTNNNPSNADAVALQEANQKIAIAAAQEEVTQTTLDALAAAYAEMGAADKLAQSVSDTDEDVVGVTCGGTTGVRCGEEADEDSYVPNNYGEYLYGNGDYNPLLETAFGTGWWTSGASGNSGYTITEVEDEDLCGKGSLSGYSCMMISKDGEATSQFITVSDANIALLEEQSKHAGYSGSGGTFVLTTTSFNCSGCTCYDNGWRDCGTEPPSENKVVDTQTISIYAETNPDADVDPSGCVNYAPSKPTLVFPPNNSEISLEEVDLQWDHEDWGANCSGEENEYYVILEKKSL